MPPRMPQLLFFGLLLNSFYSEEPLSPLWDGAVGGVLDLKGCLCFLSNGIYINTWIKGLLAKYCTTLTVNAFNVVCN